MNKEWNVMKYLNVFITDSPNGVRITTNERISQADFRHYLSDRFYVDSGCEIGALGESIINSIHTTIPGIEMNLFPHEVVLYPVQKISVEAFVRIAETIKNNINRRLIRTYNDEFSEGDMTKFRFEET